MLLRFFIIVFTIVSLFACSKRDIMFKKECNTIVNNSNFGSKRLHFRLENDQIIVTLRLDSPINKDADFIFDTGGMTMLSKEFCDENHISYSQNFYNKGFSTGFGKYSQSDIRQYIAHNIIFNVGGLKVIKPYMMIMSLKADSIYSCTPICGLIGSDFLSKFGFYADFSAHKIILYDHHKNSDSMDSFEYKLFFVPDPVQKIPNVLLKINGVNNYFDWDSGAGEDIVVEYGKKNKRNFDYFLKSHSEIESYLIAKDAVIDFQGNSALQDSFLYYLKTDSVLTDDKTIACNGVNVNYRYNPNITLTSDLVGIDFMKHFKMYINWKENTIYLKKDEKFLLNDSINQAFADFGIYFNFEKRGMYIGYVRTTSSLYKMGLRPGDIIISTDRKDIKGLNSIIDKCNLDAIIGDITTKTKIIGVLNGKTKSKEIFTIR